MKNIVKLLAAFFLSVIISFGYSWPQMTGKWKHYFNQNYVKALASRGDTLWIGHDQGFEQRIISTGKFNLFYTNNSGLISNYINAIAIDSAGNKWLTVGKQAEITDKQGLMKFDGKNWTVYTKTDSGYPIFENVFAIDSSGKLWIPGPESDLLIFNGAHWNFLSAKGKGVAWSSPLSFTIDKFNNKWIGLYDGLVKFDGTDWNYYKLSYGFPYKNIIYFLVSDSKGNIWGGTNESGIIRFDGKYWTEFSKANSPLPANGVSALYCDKHDNIWIGCCKYNYHEPDSTFGLMKYDGTNWTLFNVKNSQLPSNYITAITEDDYGNIWIGTRNKGLVKYDGTNWKSYTTSNSSLPSKNIKKITIDPKGNKWFCSDAGLAELQENSWRLFDIENSGLPVNTVNTVAFDSVYNKWIGTDSGLVKYDGKNWNLYNKWNSGLRENFVSALTIDHKGIIWIGNNRFQTAYSPPGGLTSFNGINWKIFNSDNSPLPRNLISAIKVDSQNNKWIVYSDMDEMAPDPKLGLYGLFKFNDSTWKYYLDYAGLPIYALEFDMSGKIWVGGKKFGLTVFDGKSWKNYYRENSGLPCDTVTSIAVDKNGYIWIGTFKGLAVTNGENWQIYDSLNSELKANIINSLAIDDSNNLWIAQMNNWVSTLNLDGIFVPSGLSSHVSLNKFSLSQNYPNPFNPITTIEYSIAERANVELKIFNILGREIKTLVNKEQFPGKYKVLINASLLPSGVYIYTIWAGEFRDSKKLLLIK